MKYLLIISIAINTVLFVVLGKYIPVELAIYKTKNMLYGENKCLDFSQSLVEGLEKRGIQSSIIIGESPTTAKQDDVKHAWVGLWIEPQTGQLINNYYK